MMKEVLAIDVSMHSKLCQRRLAMRKSFFCLTFQKNPAKRLSNGYESLFVL